MLKIWGRVSSSNVQAVMWCVEELKLDHERIDAGLSYGLNDTADYLAMNPNGTIPTIKDGENPPLWESGAIVRYLANTYAPTEFWPADPIARANVDRWAEWSKINVALKFTAPVFWRVVRTPPSRKDPGAIKDAVHAFEKFLQIADAQIANQKYLTGNDLTLADIQFGHCLYRYFLIDIDRGDYPNVRRYYDTLCSRPAFKKHVMVSYKELEEID